MSTRAVVRRVLLVEDEGSLVLTIRDRLLSEGMEVEVVSDGESAIEWGSKPRFDCIILDIALPKKDGFEVCRALRKRDVPTPILMLTARSQIVDRVVGLKLGADDYLTKPFDMLELVARIEALMRRSRTLATSDDAYAFGEVQVDFRRAEVRRDGSAVDLSTLELKLLRYFVEHRGDVLSRDELLDRVWGYDATPVTRTVDVHVASLRQKVGPQLIVTVHGAGYKFVG